MLRHCPSSYIVFFTMESHTVLKGDGICPEHEALKCRTFCFAKLMFLFEGLSSFHVFGPWNSITSSWNLGPSEAQKLKEADDARPGNSNSSVRGRRLPNEIPQNQENRWCFWWRAKNKSMFFLFLVSPEPFILGNCFVCLLVEPLAP